MDVDHFKALNDVRGHMYGDEVLRRVSSLMLQSLRSRADFGARYGGEEFVVLLPKTDRESAERGGRADTEAGGDGGSPPQEQLSGECLMWVTASCGVSTCESTLAGGRRSCWRWRTGRCTRRSPRGGTGFVFERSSRFGRSSLNAAAGMLIISEPGGSSSMVE